jgi:hypothetical protein
VSEIFVRTSLMFCQQNDTVQNYRHHRCNVIRISQWLQQHCTRVTHHTVECHSDSMNHTKLNEVQLNFVNEMCLNWEWTESCVVHWISVSNIKTVLFKYETQNEGDDLVFAC